MDVGHRWGEVALFLSCSHFEVSSIPYNLSFMSMQMSGWRLMGG